MLGFLILFVQVLIYQSLLLFSMLWKYISKWVFKGAYTLSKPVWYQLVMSLVWYQNGFRNNYNSSNIRATFHSHLSAKNMRQNTLKNYKFQPSDASISTAKITLSFYTLTFTNWNLSGQRIPYFSCCCWQR